MNIVYRDFSPEQLQQQYSARDAVPEHGEIFKQWQLDSEVYRAEARAFLDLAYGDTERQKLDLFLPPAESANTPLFIFMHGGYWQAMDKSFSSFIARELNQKGIAVAVVNYDLCPSVSIDVITEQMRRAVVWSWRHLGEYSVDTKRIHLSGHSAGGQLIAALMATDWQAVEPEFDSSVIRSALSISGVFDLEPLIHTGINQALRLDLEAARRNSPLYMKPKLNIPLLCLVGGKETSEFHRQNKEFVAAWIKQGIPAEYESLRGLNHFTMINEFSKPDSTLMSDVLKLINSQ